MGNSIFDLSGKVAVVIGASRGIGKRLALGFAEYGADVIPTSRSEDKIEECVKEVKELGVSSLFHPIDATKKEEVLALRSDVIDEFGRVDILLNAAGTNVKKDFLELAEDEWDKVLEVNLKSAFLTCKLFGEVMVKNNYGRIINIASMGSKFGITRSSAYCASKGGVSQLTKVIALEWAEKNVNVNAIAPGFFRTELTKPVFNNKEAYKAIMARTPKNRAGEVEELVGAAVYLASEASKFVTGETIAVDGGFTAYGI